MVRMFFQSTTENMAALLRSVRSLKFSPSGLLHITGTKRSRPAPGRLYSGALGGRKTGVCARQISPVFENASSVILHNRVWSYAVACACHSAVAREQEHNASVTVQSKQAQQFDQVLQKLDNSVKKTGRITKTMLLGIFHDICRTGYPSSNQALLLLRSCGSLLPEVHLEERTALAHRMWEKLQGLGVQYDISHYNALLKVYLQNEFKFSPTEFLAKMETANIQPNRVTYQRLIAAYCQNGDIAGASTILAFMKSKDFPITESVFNSLVTGHARANDMESAKNILSVMRGAGIEPGPDTYVSLLNAYAERGDQDGIKETLEAADNADCSLMNQDIMQVIPTLAKAGHQQHTLQLIERLKHDRIYFPDSMNLCLSLITQGQEDTAFNILKSIPALPSDNGARQGNFFIRHCINMNTSLEKMVRYCRELQELKLHSAAFTFTLFCALEANKTDMSFALMKILKEEGIPLKPHYFWPILARCLKENDSAGVVEVLKTMQDLGVSPDIETFTNYAVPAFRSIEEARQAFMDGGISLDSDHFLRTVMTVKDLGELYKLLSSPQFQSVDPSVYRNSLVMALRKSDDVENIVKIIKLLHEDKQLSIQSSMSLDIASFVVYHLIDKMTEQQIQAQEDKLWNMFNQLKAQNVTISFNAYKGIRNLLLPCGVPKLLKAVNALMEFTDDAFTGSVLDTPTATEIERNVVAFENELAALKARQKPFSRVLRKAIQALIVLENLDHAIELMHKYEEGMTDGLYANIIELCCRVNNAEEALNLKREVSLKNPSFLLDTSKYFGLIRALCQNDRLDEAVDILKEMKEKKVVLTDRDNQLLFHVLNVGAKCSVAVVQRLQDTIFTLGLVKPSSNLCAPLITAYLESGDVSGALEAAQELHNTYKVMPRIHDIIVALVEKGETDLLQKAMDFVSEGRGEMMMLYDLFFAFLQTGRYHEARKIIETPGMRAKRARLQWFSEKCIANKEMETLEQMVKMTAKLFECDRDEMYRYILQLCKETNDWQKAESTWMAMQEENVIPRERTLLLLADILKSNGQEVPFDVSEAWYAEAATTQQVDSTVTSTTTNNDEYRTRLFALTKKGKAQEAYKMLKEAHDNHMVLDRICYDVVINTLLANGYIEDATVVNNMAVSHHPGFQLRDTANSLLIISYCKRGQTKDALETLKSMLSLDQVPLRLAVIRVVQALGDHGDHTGIWEVESLMKNLGTNFNLSKMVFVNNKALALIKNDDIESAVGLLEDIYTCPDKESLGMAYVFRKVLQNDNEHALDKLSAMAERLANHFACYRPVTDLFLELVDMDKIEDAKFMLARCNAVAEQKMVLLSFVTQKSQIPGQVGKIKKLMSLIPDIADKEVLYSYLMKCHNVDNDLMSAKALFEQMQKEGIAVNELSLKRLAHLYRKAGQQVPFTEPPNTFRFYIKKLQENRPSVSAEE